MDQYPNPKLSLTPAHRKLTFLFRIVGIILFSSERGKEMFENTFRQSR